LFLRIILYCITHCRPLEPLRKSAVTHKRVSYAAQLEDSNSESEGTETTEQNEEEEEELCTPLKGQHLAYLFNFNFNIKFHQSF